MKISRMRRILARLEELELPGIQTLAPSSVEAEKRSEEDLALVNIAKRSRVGEETTSI